MTKNVDGDSLSSRTRHLIHDFEQARDPDMTEIGQQFAYLQRIMMENKDIYPSVEGAKSTNRLKNRYKDVLPYDKYRVTLSSDNDSDYINASFVEDFYNKRRYIAAQGPINESVEDFFRMIWEQQITSIICTANDNEGGRFKYLRYWPDDGKSLEFGSYIITKDLNDDRAFSNETLQVRSLTITKGASQRHVLLYHYLLWLDHDIPYSEASILDLLVRLDKDRAASPDTPILVHCSAGCGRTGSMIAIDLCRLLLRNEQLLLSETYQPYPVWTIATHIRQYRIALIQTPKQYLFVYKMFLHMMKSNGIEAPLATVSNENTSTVLPAINLKTSLPSNIPSSTRRRSGSFNLKLEDPPMGRRSNVNGTNSSKKHSPVLLPSSEPPPIPPRTLIQNNSNKNPPIRPAEEQVKIRNNTTQARFSRCRDGVINPPHFATTINPSKLMKNTKNPKATKSVRSDSADALNPLYSETNHSRTGNRRSERTSDHGAVSE